MDEERIKFLLNLTQADAATLLSAYYKEKQYKVKQELWKGYEGMCAEIRSLVVDYDVRLPLSVLQFYFYPRGDK